MNYLLIENSDGEGQYTINSSHVVIDNLGGSWIGDKYQMPSGIYKYSINNDTSAELYAITLTVDGVPRTVSRTINRNKGCSDLLFVKPGTTTLIDILAIKYFSSISSLKIIKLGDL